MIKKIRLTLAEMVLPDRFYVQEKLFPMYCGKIYPDFVGDTRIFNYRSDKIIRDSNRWLIIRMLMDRVVACNSGEYAELGTHQGRTARLIFKNMSDNAKLYCFDTFRGFDAKDVAVESLRSSFKVKAGDYGNTDEASVVRYITAGDSRDRLVICKGFFPDTAKGLEAVKWRFVHLDCDLAAPTEAGLHFFWKNLQPGGIILIHDFFGGFSEGIQGSFKEFSAETGCVAVPMCDGGGSAVIRKPW
ncbi:MAG: class I SAM-dependent methyltransferase [Phycisphaerae bacterium]|nr:class I SAM-dependent methyltransferase [Phycisphaerae bacterium]